MQIKEIMNPVVLIASPESKVVDAVKEIVNHGLDSILVGEEHKIVGIVTDGDIMKRFIAKKIFSDQVKIKEIMTEEIITADESENVEYAVLLMKQKKIKHLLVTSEGRIIGILSDSDIAKHINEIGMDSWF